MVYASQQAYYDAINASTDVAGAGPFIDFMLGEIQKAVRSKEWVPKTQPELDVGLNVGINVGIKSHVLDLVKTHPGLSAKALAGMLGTASRTVERQIAVLKKEGVLRRIGARKTGHWEIISPQKEQP